jgi:hypothetical protein
MSTRWIKGAGTALVVAWFGYGLYAAMTDRGVYRWLTERQTAWFGGHYPMLTVGMMFAAGLTAAAVISAILPRRVGPDPGATPARARTQMRLVLLAGVAFLAGAAVLAWIAVETSGKPLVYEPFDLGAHVTPRGRHVELTGVEQSGLRLSVTQGTTVTQYVPFTAPDWTPDQPVTYFLRNGAAVPTPAPTPFGRPPAPAVVVQRRGALLEDDLPGVARAGFAQHGIHLAPQVFVVDASAGAAILRYVLGAFLCAMLGLVCLVAFGAERRQASRCASRLSPTRAAR